MGGQEMAWMAPGAAGAATCAANESGLASCSAGWQPRASTMPCRGGSCHMGSPMPQQQPCPAMSQRCRAAAPHPRLPCVQALAGALLLVWKVQHPAKSYGYLVAVFTMPIVWVPGLR